MKLARALRFDKSNFSMEPKDLELPVHDIAVEATWEASENLPNRLNWFVRACIIVHEVMSNVDQGDSSWLVSPKSNQASSQQ